MEGRNWRQGDPSGDTGGVGKAEGVSAEEKCRQHYH